MAVMYGNVTRLIYNGEEIPVAVDDLMPDYSVSLVDTIPLRVPFVKGTVYTATLEGWFEVTQADSLLSGPLLTMTK